MPKTTFRNTAIDYLNRDIVNIKTDITNLSKIVRDGNGQPSLIQQVSTLANDLKHLNDELKHEIQELKNTAQHCRALSEEKSNLTWQFKTAVLVALISSLTSVVLHLLSK